MWFFTAFGFFSVVQKPGERDLTVRARVEDDLKALKAGYVPSLGEIREGEGTDYRYRANVSHEALAEGIRKAVMDIRYSNFKECVKLEQGLFRESIYVNVWNTLLKLR